MPCVYFFREKGRSSVKIGMTTNGVQERFNSFKTYCATKPYIVGVIPTHEPYSLEKELHNKFADKRLNGEFFEISDDAVYKVIQEYSPGYDELFNIIHAKIAEGSVDIDSLIRFLNNDKESEPIEQNNIHQISPEIVKEKIKIFMKSNNINTLTVSAKEIKENMFPNNQLRHRMFIKTLDGMFNLIGSIRYTSAFNHKSTVNRAYKINYTDL
jgi:hypothetical protein